MKRRAGRGRVGRTFRKARSKAREGKETLPLNEKRATVHEMLWQARVELRQLSSSCLFFVSPEEGDFPTRLRPVGCVHFARSQKILLPPCQLYPLPSPASLTNEIFAAGRKIRFRTCPFPFVGSLSFSLSQTAITSTFPSLFSFLPSPPSVRIGWTRRILRLYLRTLFRTPFLPSTSSQQKEFNERKQARTADPFPSLQHGS